jgi:magnesium transporter
MAVGEISPKDIGSILWKEVRIAMLCGLGLGVVNFVWIFFLYGQNILLSAAVTITLFSTLLIAKILGCILPIAAKFIRIDPAVMATPMITTVCDALSLVIYFSIARVILNI